MAAKCLRYTWTVALPPSGPKVAHWAAPVYQVEEFMRFYVILWANDSSLELKWVPQVSLWCGMVWHDRELWPCSELGGGQGICEQLLTEAHCLNEGVYHQSQLLLQQLGWFLICNFELLPELIEPLIPSKEWKCAEGQTDGLSEQIKENLGSKAIFLVLRTFLLNILLMY